MTGETMSTDIDAALRSADPMAGVSDAALAPALASARQNMERRRRPRLRATRWPRVLVLGGALATTAAVLTLTVGSGASGPAHLWRSGGLLPVAVAADGQMIKQSGYAAAIAPSEADLRLLPAYLPPGWSYKKIYARTETATGWDVPASLVATATTSDGTITGSLTVTGPVQATIKDQGSAADVVDGHPARLFAGTEVPEVEGYQFPGRTWWWSDAQGKQWQATTENLSPGDAQRAVEAVRTDSDQVTWKAPAASGLEVVHQRRGPAYPTARSELKWYLTLNDGQRDREVSITSHDGPDPLPVTAIRAVTGLQQSTIDGHAAVLFPIGESEGGAPEETIPGQAPCRWEDYQVSDGVRARLQACGDQDQVATMLASLTNVPADDPRLSTYALDE